MRRWNRAILADITDKGLDPKKSYSKLDKAGSLINHSHLQKDKVVKKEKDTVGLQFDDLEKASIVTEVAQEKSTKEEIKVEKIEVLKETTFPVEIKEQDVKTVETVVVQNKTETTTIQDKAKKKSKKSKA